MLNRFAFALLPILAWAQAPSASTPGAPPEVDKALRARVSEFFQYHVDGNFRKAMDLVAEDTKDEYFASGKMHLKGFEITDVKFSDEFKKAEVTTSVTMTWNIRLQENTSIVPMITTWKIEDGKWVWYHTLQTGAVLTPMGSSTFNPEVSGAKAPKLPEHIDDAALNNAAGGIVKQISLDKYKVKLSGENNSSDKVVVHNGTPGYVRLSLLGVPDIAGFSAALDKTELGNNQDATVRFTYTAASKEAPSPFQVRVSVEPFNQVFSISVNLGESPSAN